MSQFPRHIVICLLITLLTACGGGGGGGGSSRSGSEEPTPPPAPPPPAPPPTTETFRLAGLITASESQTVDTDANDPNRVAISNDTPETAQIISNPVTLGGYVNTPGTGAPGPSRISGDVDDFFRVELLAGQTITMLVADFEEADADLYLFDTQGFLVDFSVDTGDVESLVVGQDGTYFVNDGATRTGVSGGYRVNARLAKHRGV